jgi:hypothetical protein
VGSRRAGGERSLSFWRLDRRSGAAYPGGVKNRGTACPILLDVGLAILVKECLVTETPVGQPTQWWSRAVWAVGIWACPACMLGIWFCCYTEVFGEPPCSSWSERAIDGLFFLNFVAVTIFLFRSRKHPVQFLVSFLVVVAEVVVTALIWFFGGLSVSGFYF